MRFEDGLESKPSGIISNRTRITYDPAGSFLGVADKVPAMRNCIDPALHRAREIRRSSSAQACGCIPTPD
jgi:hypothetical protein